MSVTNEHRLNASSVDIASRTKQGQILFLKGPDFYDDQTFAKWDIKPGALNHPALILKLGVRRKSARVCILTTFGGRSISDTLPSLWWRDYLPIFPTPALQDQAQVRLSDDMTLPKNSYIYVGKSFVVPFSMLKGFKPPGFSTSPELDLSSFVIVAERLKINVEVHPKDIRAWSEAWQAALQTATQTTSEGEKAPHSLADEAREIISKHADQSEPTDHVSNRTLVLFWTSFAVSAALALLFRHVVLGEQSVSCDC